MLRLDEVAQLRAKLRAWRLIMSHLPGVTVSAFGVDHRCIVASINQHRELGYGDTYEFEGVRFEDMIPAERVPLLTWYFERCMQGIETTGDYPVSPTLLMEMRAVPVFENGKVFAALFFTRDITAERATAIATEAKGGRDSLTGLAKRAVLSAFVDGLLRKALPFYVLFIDLDKFKSVTDGMGHKAGDMLLERVARELQGSVRAGDLAVRLGGDEFVVVLTDTAKPSEVAKRILDRLLAVADPYGAGASIGLASYPENGRTLDDLLTSADRAMYVAKSEGGARVEKTPESR